MNKEQPNIEVRPTPQEKPGGHVVTPDGVVLTPSEVKEREKRREDDPNWFREQE